MEELKMKSSGQAISKEFSEVLYKLDNTDGPIDDTFLEVIYNVPEVKEAIDKAAGYEDTYKYKRVQLWQKWVEQLSKNNGFANEEEIVYNGDVEKGHKAFLVLGLPASGKSSVITNKLLIDNKAILLDSDEAKKIIPEYHDGWGAGAVHEESKQVNTDLLKKILIEKAGANVVVPIVGKKDKVKEFIRVFREFDYDISMHLVEIKPKTSMSRMLKRFIMQNRFINPKVVANYGDEPSRVFEEMKGMVDEYVKWSNEVKQGEQPICVDKGSSRENGKGMGEGGSATSRSIEGDSQPCEGSEGKELKYPWQTSLAEEIATLEYDLDTYEYWDVYGSYDEGLETIENDLKDSNGIESLKYEINETVVGTDDIEDYINASVISARLDCLTGEISKDELDITVSKFEILYDLKNDLESNDIYVSFNDFKNVSDELLQQDVDSLRKLSDSGELQEYVSSHGRNCR